MTIPTKPGVTVPRPLPPASYEPPGLGRLRKIALIGTAQTWAHAPFHDPSWEIWAHASAAPICPRVDRFFDLHPKHVWDKPKTWMKKYPQWIRTVPVPVYMQERHADVPQSIRFPKERVFAEFRRYATNQVAYMIALALSEGVTHLGFFGIHYAAADERHMQRAGCEYWMGVAEGRGVQLVIPQGCPLLHEPPWLYGYENYNPDGTQKKVNGVPKVGTVTPFDPATATVIDEADATAKRPPLMVLPTGEAPAWDRSGHQHHF